MEFDQRLVDVLKDFVEAKAWHSLGDVNSLKSSNIRRLYGDIEADDVVLIYDDSTDRFYALDAVCSHEGGPLDLGDIEDINGTRCIVCPWHHYEFNISTGLSDSSGLQQDVYPLMEIEGTLYIRTGDMELSGSPRADRDQKNSTNNLNETTHQLDHQSPLDPKSLPTDSVTSMAYKVLTASNALQKVELSQMFGEKWNSGAVSSIGEIEPPDQPTRSDDLCIVPPGKEAKRGKGGSLASRISILHSMANIELWAIDLSWDVVARFAPHFTINNQTLPKEFVNDFIKVALDETKHFNLLNQRLIEMGSHFGALPVHNGLWESAEVTNHSLLARLAVVHMVHEARGLDVQPFQMKKFERQNDTKSLSILDTVYKEEITHVEAGLKWFTYICKQSRPQIDPVTKFHEIVKENFKGYLKPPFNTQARSRAGMTPEWYEPLTKPQSSVTSNASHKVHTSVLQKGFDQMSLTQKVTKNIISTCHSYRLYTMRFNRLFL